MYLQNKYTTWYNNIIKNAQNRNIDGYTERHHIIPKSLGGSNDKENLVDLTAKEHFVCHLLLPKMTDGESKRKMSFALWALTKMDKTGDRYKVNGRTFSIVREQYSNALKGRKIPDNVKEKIRKTNTGKIQSEETKRKRSISHTGKKQTEKQKLAVSTALKNKTRSPETIQKIKDARAKQLITTVHITCPHCGKIGGNRIMPRYHFTNCKEAFNVINNQN
jgi:hypothetical protein